MYKMNSDTNYWLISIFFILLLIFFLNILRSFTGNVWLVVDIRWHHTIVVKI